MTKQSVRWRGLFVSLGILTLIEVCVWLWLNYWVEDASFQAVSLWLYALLFVVVFILWWVAFSRIPWGPRLLGLVLFVCMGFGIKWAFHFEGFTGSSLPQISHRWNIGSEEDFQTVKPVAENVLRDWDNVEITDKDWPEYRGPRRDGVVRHLDGPVDWLVLEEVWRHPVGAGWSSFSVVGSLAYTQEQRQDMETVVCYELETGRTVWIHEDPVRFSEAMGGDGPRATPTFYGGKLVVQGATGILNCLNAYTGEVLWSKNILDENQASLPEWGMAGSPLVLDDRVYVSPGGPDGQSFVAYDLGDGSKVWSAGNSEASYSSPCLHEYSGVRQILIFNAQGLDSHDLETGTLLWQFPFENFSRANVAQPERVDDDKVLVTAGYSKGGVLLRPFQENGEWQLETIWTSRRIKTKFNTVVVEGPFAYGFDEGILVCVDLESGERMWKGGRYGYGQLLLVGEELLIQSESGDLIIMAADPSEQRVITKHPALSSKTWNHPAIGGDYLLVRNAEEAVCYRLSMK